MAYWDPKGSLDPTPGGDAGRSGALDGRQETRLGPADGLIEARLGSAHGLIEDREPAVSEGDLPADLFAAALKARELDTALEGTAGVHRVLLEGFGPCDRSAARSTHRAARGGGPARACRGEAGRASRAPVRTARLRRGRSRTSRRGGPGSLPEEAGQGGESENVQALMPQRQAASSVRVTVLAPSRGVEPGAGSPSLSPREEQALCRSGPQSPEGLRTSRPETVGQNARAGTTACTGGGAIGRAGAVPGSRTVRAWRRGRGGVVSGCPLATARAPSAGRVRLRCSAKASFSSAPRAAIARSFSLARPPRARDREPRARGAARSFKSPRSRPRSARTCAWRIRGRPEASTARARSADPHRALSGRYAPACDSLLL